MIPAAVPAYRECEAITRRRAQNFYYGIRLLPAEKRLGMCAVYAFARRVDDIGDGDLPPAEKLRALAALRADVEVLGTVQGDAVLAALADAQRRFGLPREALVRLLDGVEMDVHGAHFERFDDLVAYCRLVAGTIGRLSVAIFGAADRERADHLADDLGVAMQLTNIVRDIREDALLGRVYLPAEDLRAAGIEGSPLDARPEALTAVVRTEAARAREWFDRGLQLVPLLDARSAACLLAMTGVYRRILLRIEHEPAEVARRRVSLPPWERGWVAAASLATAGGRLATAAWTEGPRT
jgi:phytoene synthase